MVRKFTKLIIFGKKIVVVVLVCCWKWPILCSIYGKGFWCEIFHAKYAAL